MSSANSVYRIVQNNFITSRLTLSPLTLDDLSFIFELVNTPAWKKFIGDRNIKTKEDAANYIQKIIYNPAVNYIVVRLRNEHIPIGIITFIKREYLEHSDIGFAFLPEYAKQGYAFEASSAVLNFVAKDSQHTQILATTIEQNINSIRLLEKLDFRFSKKIRVEDQELFLYSVSADQICIDNVIKSFYGIFENANSRQPNWDLFYNLCLPESIIIKKTGAKEEIYNLQTFITPRKQLLSGGTLTEFSEYEIYQETRLSGNIAQRFSKYEKKGFLNAEYFKESGTKMFQLIKSNETWKINAIVWEDDKNK